MILPTRLLAPVCALFLAACTSDDASLHETRGSTVPGPLAHLTHASVEDLYFEVVQLTSRGLISSSDFEALQRALDDMDGVSQGNEQERMELYRSTLMAFLRRTLPALQAGEYANVLEAEQEGRGYARKLHQAGVREAERHAEYTLFVAGMLGVPTSQEELVLMVAIPVGGYIVVRVAGVAFKRAPLLLRHLRSADDVVDEARRQGFPTHYVATQEEMRALAGDLAARVADAPPVHVGGLNEKRRRGKLNVWNPSERRDNCTACVAATIRNSLEGYFEYSADDMERFFGYTGRERRLTVSGSLKYIEDATGLRASKKPIALNEPGAPIGHYAIMTRWNGSSYDHVIYGRVTPTGRITLFDPQAMKRMNYEQMVREYGSLNAAYLLEAQ